MATVVITGGTGLIGKALASLLVKRDYRVIILTRKLPAAAVPEQNIEYALWNPAEQTIDNKAIEEADYIVHLAGAGVADKRWTEKRKTEIKESRIQGSNLLIKAIRETPNKVKAVVSSSAIGWYGPDPKIPNPKPFVESDPADFGFLGETCRLWEESIQPVINFGKRLVKLRTGIVLSNKGGAFKEFKKPVRWGVAGVLGSGKQVISWIHIDDLCRMYVESIENKSISGVYNAVAPRPVSNKELTVKLARIQKGNFFIPMYVPSFALKLALGGVSEEVLKSATVSCEKIRKAGFDFIYPSIESALNELLYQGAAKP